MEPIHTLQAIASCLTPGLDHRWRDFPYHVPYGTAGTLPFPPGCNPWWPVLDVLNDRTYPGYAVPSRVGTVFGEAIDINLVPVYRLMNAVLLHLDPFLTHNTNWCAATKVGVVPRCATAMLMSARAICQECAIISPVITWCWVLSAYTFWSRRALSSSCASV